MRVSLKLKLSVSQKATLKHFKSLECSDQRRFVFEKGGSYGITNVPIHAVAAVCKSWSNLLIEMPYKQAKAPVDDNARWAWLWEGVEFNAIDLAQLTGLGEYVLFAIDIVIGNKLVYPDGSVSNFIDLELKLPFMDKDDKIKKGLIES